MSVKKSRSGRPEHDASDDLARLASAVRAARVAHALTQAELAGVAGTGVRFIVELEQAKPTLQIGKVFRVLATLGLTLNVHGVAGNEAERRS